VTREAAPARVRARAPVRVDFAGGWSDVPAFAEAEGGVVTNAALQRYVHVDAIRGGQGIRLVAEDLGRRVTARRPADLLYDGTLDLHKAAVNMLPVTGGLELLTRSDVPAGSGLGASGALDVALVSALARLRRESYAAPELAELGFHLEAVELRLDGGRQDQYAAALGGVRTLAFARDAVDTRAIPLEPAAVAELERALVIAYTGQSHFSAQTHRRVWAAYADGRPETVDALRAIRDLGVAAAEALDAADWPRLARVVDDNWAEQRRLDATISTPGVRAVESALRAAGAWGVKAAGAGAGGCLLALCAPDARAAVVRAATAAGARVLEARLDFQGVTVWEDDAPDPDA
jgi:D-glycero-alpha-D-manno-heptose-7-phosphate kinase